VVVWAVRPVGGNCTRQEPSRRTSHGRAGSAYIGSAFIATEAASAHPDYKQMIVDSDTEDIVYTDLRTEVHAKYLKPSVVRSGLDPDNLPVSDPSAMVPAAGLISPLRDEYRLASARIDHLSEGVTAPVVRVSGSRTATAG